MFGDSFAPTTRTLPQRSGIRWENLVATMPTCGGEMGLALELQAERIDDLFYRRPR